MTKNFKLYAVTDLESPYTIPLKNPGITEPPKSWVVMTPEISWNQQLEVYLATATTGTAYSCSILTSAVLCVREDSVQDMLIDKGPFLRMALSPNGKIRIFTSLTVFSTETDIFYILAVFSSNGNVWIVQSDFSTTLSTFETKYVQFEVSAQL